MKTVSIEQVFGCAFDEVSDINRLIVLFGRRPVPKWIMGRPKFLDLPRVMEKRFIHTASVDHLRHREIGRRAQWIIDACHGFWFLSEDGFHFEKSADLHVYQLRWGA